MKETIFSIRRGAPADVAALTELDRRCAASSWSGNQWAEEVSKPFARVWVAARGERMIGFGVYWMIAGEAQLANIAVDPSCRREGVGGRLLRHLLEEARRESAVKMTLEARAGNLAALSLYQKAGFLETTRRAKYYEGVEEAVLMGKDLRDRGGLSVTAAVLLAAGLCLAPLAARATEGDNYRVYLRGLLEERAGKFSQALAAYQELLRREPSASFLQASVAEVALRAGRTDEALSAAQAAVALSTANADGYILLGRVHLARGERSKAQAAFDRALALEPSNVEALGWAASHRELTDPDSTRRLFEDFLVVNPDEEIVRSRLAQVQQRQGDLKAAAASWQRLLEDDPGDVEALLGLAGVYDVWGDTVAAMGAYENYLEADPDNVEVLTRLGQLYYEAGLMEDARRSFSRAAELVPGDPGLTFWRAMVAQAEEDWTEAARQMEEVAKKSQEPGVLLRLASYHSHQGNQKEAVRVLARLQKSQPENPDFMLYLALGYEDMEKPRSAIHWLNKALAKDPDRADVHFHLAINWDKRRRFDRVVRHLQRTIEIQPNNHVALNYLGYSWADRNERLEEALELIQRAVALDPNNPAYRDSLGWVYFRLGRLPEAETALGAAVYRADDAVVWQHFGDVLDKLGRGPEAVRAWQEGVLLDPNNKDLLKRLGEEGRPSSVSPLSAPRTLLKRVEGNYRQLSGLSGLAAMTIRTEGRAFSGQGLFYYGRPGRFRLEVMGPFFAPQAVLIYDGERVEWRPDHLGVGDEGPWLGLWARVLTGDFFKAFDDPSVAVRQEGTVLIYSAPAGELRLDARKKCLVRAVLSPPGAAPIRLDFSQPREEEGIVLPGQVDGGDLGGGVSFSLRFSRLTVNPRLDPSLFLLAP